MKPDSKKLTLHRPAPGSNVSRPNTARLMNSRKSATNTRSHIRPAVPIWCFRSDGEPALVAASAPDQRRDKEVTRHDQS